MLNTMSGVKVWTIEATDNGISRASTAAVNAAIKHPDINNPYIVGVQSRFRRKYFHKIIFLALIVIIILLVMGIIILSCYNKYYAIRICESTECLRAAANLKLSMDQSIDPCDDFYKFTCGNWPDEHPRPDSVSSNDWFFEKQYKVMRTIRKFLQGNNSDDDPLPVKQARSMYTACMDTDTMDNLGLTPMFSYLKKLGLPRIPTILNVTGTDYQNYNFDWIKTIAVIKRSCGMDVMIGFDLMADPTNRTLYRLAVGTPETESGLPFTDDLEKKLKIIKKKISIEADQNVDDIDDEDSIEGITAYEAYITEVITAIVKEPESNLTASDYQENIEKAGKMIVNMTKLIYRLTQEAENASKSKEADPLTDMINMYHYELQNATDYFIAPRGPIPIWEKYFTQLFLEVPDIKLDLGTDKLLTSRGDLMYLQSLIDEIANTSVAQLELFIWWSMVEDLILHTTVEMRALHNHYAKTVTNLEGSIPRSLSCASGVNQLLGMAVSYSIAENEFLNVTKPKVEVMLKLIRESFNGLVKATSWMDEETKKATLEKSDAMNSLIGFPDWILQKGILENFYKGIKVNQSTHLDNIMGILKRNVMEKMRNLRSTNKFGWATAPTNVNAFHTFQANAITIPLAILQYPFYHLGLEALNYGAIGTVLGHELTHGFDDSGRHFDKNGNMRQWWSNNTITEYINRTSCFVSQYGGYFLPEVSDYINGELTLSENIADNGGLREAYLAYQNYKMHYGKEQLLPGFENYTHDQLFFMSFGNLWCESSTNTATKWALEDSHCPGRIRLRGVISNSPEFSQTFNCKPGSGMNPTEDRCRIW